MRRTWELFVLAAVEKLILYSESAMQLPPNSSLSIIETESKKEDE